MPDPLVLPQSYNGPKIGNRYSLGPLIGQGGEAKVYAAWHHVAQIPVAIRVPLKPPTGYPPLDLPHFVGWVRCWDIGNDPVLGDYQVLEYLDGCTLAQFISDNGRLRVYHEGREFIYQTISALIALHHVKWVHADLHPSNFFRHTSQEEDFKGALLWKLLELPFLSYFPENRTNPTFGSIYTMAPERIDGQPPSFLSDLYSLGCTYYYALSGRYPHLGNNSAEIAIGHLHFDPEPLHEITDVSLALSRWVQKMMARKPEDRFESAVAAKHELRHVFAYLVPKRP